MLWQKVSFPTGWLQSRLACSTGRVKSMQAPRVALFQGVRRPGVIDGRKSHPGEIQELKRRKSTWVCRQERRGIKALGRASRRHCRRTGIGFEALACYRAGPWSSEGSNLSPAAQPGSFRCPGEWDFLRLSFQAASPEEHTHTHTHPAPIMLYIFYSKLENCKLADRFPEIIAKATSFCMAAIACSRSRILS